MSYRVHRDLLYKQLGLGRLTPDFEGRWEGVILPSRDWSLETKAYGVVPGVWTIIAIKAPVGRLKSSTHRLFVECCCGRLIPIGRLDQHIPRCKDRL